jgi:hypothetical protein
MFGMIEDYPETVDPADPELCIDHRSRILAHPARADRVKHRRYDTLHPFADLGARLDARAGLDLFRNYGRQRLLP